MNDTSIIQQIGRLVDEEHELARTSDGLSPIRTDRRREIEIELDQCWDLLRQRRARRSAGGDPADAAVRPASVVENYRQ
jgi:hypothetical protein